MALKLSLTAKGLILVSIPLCFEIAFVCVLVNLQHGTEVEAEQALKSRAISNRLNTITSNLYQIWNVFDTTHSYGETNNTSRVYTLYKSKYLPVFATLKKD